MSTIQERIQHHFDTLVDTDAEAGLQVAVYHDGVLIVDTAAGTANPATGRPVKSGTPIFGFSTGKNMAATLAHLLVAHGFLDYDTLVTDLWPEFGAHGKDTATLRHVLTHTVGLPAMPREISLRPSDPCSAGVSHRAAKVGPAYQSPIVQGSMTAGSRVGIRRPSLGPTDADPGGSTCPKQSRGGTVT